MKHILFTLLLLLGASSLFAQPLPMQTDSMRLEKYRTEIGLDMSVPDFDSKTIDANVMGSRLAGILDYMMENFQQPVYSRKICQILKEQSESLEKLEFEIKKIEFVSAHKSGAEITLIYTAWPNKNTAKVKQTDLIFHFKKGVSESQVVNELFSMMSRYVQRREQLQN